MADGILTRRKVAQSAVDLIKHWEGFNATPYLCPAKIWSIGYGHTRTVRAGQKITQEEAATLLDDDLSLVARTVQRLVTVPLNDAQFGALVAFCLNVGVANFERSTLLTLLNRGWYDQVPAQLMRWNRAGGQELGGLSRRRAAEARLWNSWASQGEQVA